jgi:CRP-like cAMP-binding protein
MDAEPLRNLPLFAELSDDELHRVAPFASEVVVHPGHRLVKQGEFAYDFFVIEDGTAEVLRDGEHVTDLGAGDFFGEIGLLEKDLRNADVVAKTDMQLVTLSGWDLRRLARSAPQVVEQIRAVIDQRKGS